MKYIIQFFREVNPGPVSWSGSLLEFQVIFSARSKKEADKKGEEVFRAWRNDEGQVGMSYASQLQNLNDFIITKESQYKVIMGLK